MGLQRIRVLEFGTAGGEGLRNLGEIARRVTKTTGVEVEVFGFDGGTGLPEPRDYRDHPDLYQAGTFLMPDPQELIASLPPNTKLVQGEVATTVPQFVAECSGDAPIGFLSVDLDYYFSAVDALKIFDGPPEIYLPSTTVYLDDVSHERHNPWCGELLAVREFNEEHELRKISRYTDLRAKRIFKNAGWIDKIYTAHILDHQIRQHGRKRWAEATA
jgi:hypothetical protein